MKLREITTGAVLTALAIIIPIQLGFLKIIIPPFTATLASHVPMFIAMVINPTVAVMVGVGSTIGFLLTAPLYVAARAASHIIVGLVGAVLIKKGKPMTAAFASFGEKTEVIFANNDMMGLGAIAALNAVGYNTGKEGDPKITVIGVDAVDAATEAIKAGKMAATVKQDGDAMGKAVIRLAINGALKKGFLDGTDYKMSADGYSIRIPYAKITD
jgi:ABC-type sugar transport system substrate-binding protein